MKSDFMSLHVLSNYIKLLHWIQFIWRDCSVPSKIPESTQAYSLYFSKSCFTNLTHYWLGSSTKLVIKCDFVPDIYMRDILSTQLQVWWIHWILYFMPPAEVPCSSCLFWLTGQSEIERCLSLGEVIPLFPALEFDPRLVMKPDPIPAIDLAHIANMTGHVGKFIFSNVFSFCPTFICN